MFHVEMHHAKTLPVTPSRGGLDNSRAHGGVRLVFAGGFEETSSGGQQEQGGEERNWRSLDRTRLGLMDARWINSLCHPMTVGVRDLAISMMLMFTFTR